MESISILLSSFLTFNTLSLSHMLFIYNTPVLVLGNLPIVISSHHKLLDFILLLIKPKLMLKFSQKESFGPTSDNSLSIVVTPRSSLNLT